MARLFKADHARRIDLEGVGAALRPVDIDQAKTGFSVLRTLRVYRFDPPAVIKGHAEEDEVFIVVLEGEIDLKIRSSRWPHNDTRIDLKAADQGESVVCAAYLPPQAEYELTPRTAADVAYARALPAGGRSPAVFATKPRPVAEGRQLLLEESSHAERLRLQLWRVDTRETVTDLVSPDHPVAAGEALIHVRSAPDNVLTVEAQGLPGVGLNSWDTVAIAAGERPRIRVAASSSAFGLVVTAA
jgi:hypothetical protein